MAIENYVAKTVFIEDAESQSLEVMAGVFVTLNYQSTTGQEYLRGCVGYPIPQKKLRESVVEAAIAAAAQDPRFPPVDLRELDNITVEVSILSPLEEIKVSAPADYVNQIVLGRDGLVLKWRYGSGLLLPQVPVEQRWDLNEYLANICYKAGAPPDVWLDPESRLYRFQAVVFKELKPGGPVQRLTTIGQHTSR